MSPSQLKSGLIHKNVSKYAEGTSEQQRYATAQAIIDARQQQARAGCCSKQCKSDFNAARKGSSRSCSTGYDAWVEAQRQAAEQKPIRATMNR